MIALYNKAIEYYSALNDDKHLDYLNKLQTLFSDDRIQKIMKVGDANSTPQNNESNEEEKLESIN